MTVRVGVVGTGRWAVLHHLPALRADGRTRVTAAADPNPARLAAAAGAFGIERTFTRGADLYDSGLVDAVVIASTHATHYAQARAALDRRLHVLLEKPMALDGAEAWDLVARAHQAGVHLVVGYPFNFSRHVGRAREIVAAGTIGRPRLVSALYTSPRAHLYRPSGRVPSPTEPDPVTYADPAAGGGHGQTETTHALANLLFVTGLRPVRVSAQMRSLDYPVDVLGTMLLEFAGGGVGTLASTGVVSGRYPPQREFRYYGSHGVLLQDLATGALAGSGADGPIVAPPCPPEDLYPTGRPVRCLVDLVTGGGWNPSPGTRAAEVVCCLAAAYRSARSGGGPVVVPTRPPSSMGTDVDDMERLGQPAGW